MSVIATTNWENSFSDTLSRRWDDYVDCDKRMLLEGPFLKAVLGMPGNGRILDAGMANGCESIFLAQQGYQVIGNEIDKQLQRRAAYQKRKAGVDFQITGVDWRELEDHFEPASLAAVLIVGNSLGLLSNPEDRRRVCEQVYRLLTPGGIFIVDRRNYDYMFREKKAILSGDFKYTSRVMYCQRSIVSRPTIINADRVRIACFDRSGGGELGHFDVYPFRELELDKLVIAAGFGEIAHYWDFEEKEPTHWDFETLVCKKT